MNQGYYFVSTNLSGIMQLSGKANKVDLKGNLR